MITIASSTLGLLIFALLLTLIILLARKLLVPATAIAVTVNQERQLNGQFGDTLLNTLSGNDIHVPSACAGAGTCGLCRIHVERGVTPPTPIEKALLPTQALHQGQRLACQVHLRTDLSIKVPEDVLSTHAWQARVVSNQPLSPLIREIMLQPNTDEFLFEPGDFMQVTAPAGDVWLADIDPGAHFRTIWQSLGVSHLGVHSDTDQTRAYSIANRPADSVAVTLMIRLALPPMDALDTIPTGFVSGFLCTRKPGDGVLISGPHRGFHIIDESRELVFIGGGVGMAPLRSMIHRQIGREHREPLTFFYGARTQDDLLYRDEFDALSDANNGFSWIAALSEPADDWPGKRGFIHTVLATEFLATHASPQSCDYYLCGPPLMIKAVLDVLHAAGVQDTHIYKDEFE